MQFLQPFDMRQLEADEERFFLSLRGLRLHDLPVERKEPVFHMRPILRTAVVQVAATRLLQHQQQVFGTGRGFILQAYPLGAPTQLCIIILNPGRHYRR